MEYRDILPTSSVAGTELRAQGKKERRVESVETEGESVRPSDSDERKEMSARVEPQFLLVYVGDGATNFVFDCTSFLTQWEHSKSSEKHLH